jgi:TATA-box binding protein (TBP) (component of TFIID and TFIIIB)
MSSELHKPQNDKAIDIKISTITLSTQLPYCHLNLTNIGKYLDIDNEILGLKYNYAALSVTKGKYSTTIYKKAKIKDSNKINKALFYNQITLICNNKGNNVNVKLFGNGSLHLTGCKSVEEGVVVTKIIYEKLVSLNNKTDTILLTKDLNGVLLDKDNLVYSYNTKQIIGHKLNNSDLYVINKKEYMIDNKTQMFISNKLETQRRRFIYNFDGNLIGSSKIELLKNKNKFYKKNVNIFFDTTNDLIYHNNETIIGKIVYTIDDTNLINDIKKIPDIMEIKYKCNPFHNNDYNLDLNRLDFKEFIDLNVNCINVYFNINFIINRQRFYEKLIDLNYICKYKPESYSGIKLIYKINLTNDIENQGSSITNNLQEKTGHCHCSSKCTCINITFLIFQSGNVIVTGFKMTEQIKPVIDNFINLCNTMRFNIEKRSFIKLQ